MSTTQTIGHHHLSNKECRNTRDKWGHTRRRRQIYCYIFMIVQLDKNLHIYIKYIIYHICVYAKYMYTYLYALHNIINA